MPALSKRPSCVQAEPPRLPWAPRLGEASQAPAASGIKTRSQWESQPKLAAAPGPLLQGVQPQRRGKPQPCCHSYQPFPAALPSESQGDLLAAGKGFFLGQKGLVAELLPASSLLLGLATPLTSTHPACPHVPVVRCPGHPTRHTVRGGSWP